MEDGTTQPEALCALGIFPRPGSDQSIQSFTLGLPEDQRTTAPLHMNRETERGETKYKELQKNGTGRTLYF